MKEIIGRGLADIIAQELEQHVHETDNIDS
jgi:hypothetical protein